MMHRRPSEKTFLFGIHPVLEALEEGKSLHRVLLSKRETNRRAGCHIGNGAERSIFQHKPVPKERLDRVTQKKITKASSLSSRQWNINLLMRSFLAHLNVVTPHSLWRLMASPDVRNLGAIARTAECFGATALLVPSTGSAPINEDAAKSSAGALLRIPDVSCLQHVRCLVHCIPAGASRGRRL